MTAPFRPLRWAAAALASAAGLVLMAWASAAPLSYQPAGVARLRLSWNARPERIEVCRSASDEELEREEEHMRQRVVCDGRFATYALRVEADGRLLSESVVRGAGLRHDRPVYLLRDFDLASGVHRVRVSFTRRERTDTIAPNAAPSARGAADTGIFAGRAEREADERRRRARAAIPARLVLDTTLAFAPGRVLVVTFNQDRRAFEVLGGRGPSR
jgi:hypothetical protein